MASFVPSAGDCTSLTKLAGSATASGALESKLDRVVSVGTAVVSLGVGVSGREGRSEDARGLPAPRSLPLLTALASRSCNLELGLLREEFRDRPCKCQSLTSSTHIRRSMPIHPRLYSAYPRFRNPTHLVLAVMFPSPQAPFPQLPASPFLQPSVERWPGRHR